MKVKFTNIVWDTDGEDVELPEEDTIEVDPDKYTLGENAADVLSDEHGWCVLSFDYEIVT